MVQVRLSILLVFEQRPRFIQASLQILGFERLNKLTLFANVQNSWCRGVFAGIDVIHVDEREGVVPLGVQRQPSVVG